MKQLSDEHRNQTDPTHQVEGQNAYQNYRPFNFHKMINQGEDSPREEDSTEEEDSPEEGDIREEEEYHPEDHQEAVGDHHRYLCHKFIKGSWWENPLQSTTVTGRRRPCSSTNGSYIGRSTMTMPS